MSCNKERRTPQHYQIDNYTTDTFPARVTRLLITETHNVVVAALDERLSSLWHGGSERGARRRLLAPYLHRDTVIAYKTRST